AITGLVKGHNYYVIAPDLLHIQLADVDNPSLAISIDPSALPATQVHTLTAVQRFTVVADGSPAQGDGFAYLDVKGRLRSTSTPYSVIVDAVNTSGDANLRLWGSVQETSVGTAGAVHVIDSPTGDYFNHYEPDAGAHAPLDMGAFGSGAVHI